MNRWLGRAGLVFGSIVIALGIAEIAARLVLPPPRIVEVEHLSHITGVGPRQAVVEHDGLIDQVIDWSGEHGIRLHPNLSATIKNHVLSHQDVVIETNSLGLRYPELGPKRAGELRILVLGDSITFGDYLEASETFPADLERLFAERGRPSVRAINAGLPGASTRDEYYHYLEIDDAIHPDVVLVAMYLNDAQDSEKFYARKLRPPWSDSRLLTWVVQRLQLVQMSLFTATVAPAGIDPSWKEAFRNGRNLHSGDMLHSRDGFDFEIYNAAMDFGLAWNPQSWQILRAIVGTFRDAVRQNGEGFAVALLPIHLQVLGDVGDVVPQTQFTEMCRSLRLRCLDLLPALREEAAHGGGKVYFDHCHLRANGNAAVARALYDWLNRDVL